MTKIAGKMLTGAVAALGLLAATAGAAVALDYSVEARAQSGTHQFYVWCTGEEDYTGTMQGSSAEDAQMKMYEQLKGEGKTNCWPIWQGLTS